MQPNNNILLAFIILAAGTYYKCASANVVHNFMYKSKAYIGITDPGIYLATTKTVYILIETVTCKYLSRSQTF